MRKNKIGTYLINSDTIKNAGIGLIPIQILGIGAALLLVMHKSLLIVAIK